MATDDARNMVSRRRCHEIASRIDKAILTAEDRDELRGLLRGPTRGYNGRCESRAMMGGWGGSLCYKCMTSWTESNFIVFSVLLLSKEEPEELRHQVRCAFRTSCIPILTAVRHLAVPGVPRADGGLRHGTHHAPADAPTQGGRCEAAAGGAAS
jgi:hypothetical protein